MSNFDEIINKLPSQFKEYKITKIAGEASQKKNYRLISKHDSFIVMDFILIKKEYEDYLAIYDLLKKINISIPKIIENNDKELLIISEDFGNLRFDKILNNYSIKELLGYAVDTLVMLNNSIKYETRLTLKKYDFTTFKSEIMELPDYYFPYKNIKNKILIEEFIFIWSEFYDKLDFEFNSFVHKDFNINNLILLPHKKDYLKCGVIDFQSAFWGESSWDLFSLLEDSRILFTDDFNEYFINFFYEKTHQNNSIEDFKKKFYFFNTSRQTRLLGRWIKLSNELESKSYLKFLLVTEERLKKSIKFLNDKKISKFYNKYIFNI
jgi:N-acetylmuramate 1-kinase